MDRNRGTAAAQNAPWRLLRIVDCDAPYARIGCILQEAGDEAGEKLAAEMKEFDRVACELLAELNCDATYEQRVEHVMKTAADLFGLAPTWTAFYRAVLGGEGVMRKGDCGRRRIGTVRMLRRALQTIDNADHPAIPRLARNDPFEPQRMITVRIPKSLHDAICDEANVLAVSVNKLCISRLLQRTKP